MQGLIKIILGLLCFNIDPIGTLFFGIELTQHANPILLTCVTFIRLIGLFSILLGFVSIYKYGSDEKSFFDISLFKKKKQKNQIKTNPNNVQSNTHKNPIVNKIDNIISELSKLQQEFKNKDLDTNIFIKFNLLKDKFDKDLKNTQHVVNKLQYIGKNDNQSYLQLLNNYLDLFNEEKQTIYNHIQQQCNEELNVVNNELDDFNKIIDKVI